MPMPTTRYGRFKWRRGRYAKRLRRYHGHNNGTKAKTLGHHGGGKIWSWSVGPMLAPHGVSSRSFSGNRVTRPGIPSVQPVFSGGGTNGWPHVTFTALHYLSMRAAGEHQYSPLVGFQLRRVRRIGRKLGRMNGLQRRNFGAEYFAYLHGYFPDWDPFLRFPQLADFEADPDSSVEGLWPWGEGPP